jgi:glutamate-1-semialdehyde 2,1-aminomutase
MWENQDLRPDRDGAWRSLCGLSAGPRGMKAGAQSSMRRRGAVIDYEEIQKRRVELTRGPVFAIPESRMAEVYKRIEERCPGSRQVYDVALKHIPGGAQHMLVNKVPYPITARRALGSKIWDVDGNEYTDYLMMAGPVILGHNYPPLIEQVTRVMREEGVGTGWTSEWEIETARLIKKHIPSIELFRYFQSGTEANMAAARVARVFTNKKKIVKVGGSYHGWADQFVYSMHIPYSSTLDSQGIPSECYDQLICIPPNDVDGLRTSFEESESEDGIAAVFLEALGGEAGATPMHPDFPREVRELCDRYNSLFVLDEVVTAFRVDMGGAQAYYDVRPDLTVLGKILAHGFPSAGGVGGKKEVMECFVAGLQPGKGLAFVAGTMGANPITASAGYWALRFIEDENAVQRAGDAGDKLTRGLNDLFGRLGFPFFAYNFKSIVHFETAAPVAVDLREKDAIPNALNRKKAVDDLGAALLAEGVITKYGNRAFTSMAHTDEDIESTLEAFEKVLSLIPK